MQFYWTSRLVVLIYWTYKQERKTRTGARGVEFAVIIKPPAIQHLEKGTRAGMGTREFTGCTSFLVRRCQPKGLSIEQGGEEKARERMTMQQELHHSIKWIATIFITQSCGEHIMYWTTEQGKERNYLMLNQGHGHYSSHWHSLLHFKRRSRFREIAELPHNVCEAFIRWMKIISTSSSSSSVVSCCLMGYAAAATTPRRMR